MEERGVKERERRLRISYCVYLYMRDREEERREGREKEIRRVCKSTNTCVHVHVSDVHISCSYRM